jgi:hypothetical protein
VDQRPVVDIVEVRNGGDTSGGVTGQGSRNDGVELVDLVLADPLQRPETRVRGEVHAGIDESGQESSFVGGDPTSVEVLPSGLDADDPVAFHEDGGTLVAEPSTRKATFPRPSMARRLAAAGIADST